MWDLGKAPKLAPCPSENDEARARRVDLLASINHFQGKLKYLLLGTGIRYLLL